VEYRFYELTGDAAEELHFRHFEGPEVSQPSSVRDRIRLGAELSVGQDGENSARSRVSIHE
jgi:hypothetical protein